MNEADKEVQKMTGIKALVTIAAVVALAVLAFITWNEKGEYYISIPTDETQTWSCEVSDESVLRETEAVSEDGKYKVSFEAVGAGDAEITLLRSGKGSLTDILEERVYHVRVADDMTVMQLSVDREVKEE